MRETPGDAPDETADGLRVGPWVPPPRTGARRRGRHAVDTAPPPVPVFDPADAATQHLPVDTPPETGRRGRWIAAAAIAVGLAVIVVVPVVAALHSGHPSAPAAVPPVPTPAGTDTSAAGTAPGASTGPSVTHSPSPSRSPSPSPRSSAPVPPFAPVAIEAEDPRNSVGGSAWVVAYDGASGGRIVRNLGLWNGSPKHAGWLRVTATVPAAGTYLVTVYVVHPDGVANRTLVVQVADGPTVTVEVNADDTCCTPVRIRVALRAGANAITFTNTGDHAPSIDRVVVSG
jgi:hypothetical protein